MENQISQLLHKMSLQINKPNQPSQSNQKFQKSQPPETTA